MMRLKMRMLVSLAMFSSMAANAATTTYDVKAVENSIANGVGAGLATITLNFGDSFTVTASTNDLWSSGSLPRFSDANGLSGDRFATASDDSGQALGTKIGQSYPTYTTNGFTAYYGQLVGLIGNTYIALGTNYSGIAAESGQLKLFYWDENVSDNSGQISVSVTTVPEPESMGLFAAGLALVGLLRRRK